MWRVSVIASTRERLHGADVTNAGLQEPDLERDLSRDFLRKMLPAADLVDDRNAAIQPHL
jgi:hypothetical protein